MLLSFSLLAVGGFAIGLILGYGIGKLRDLLVRLHASDPLIEITLSLLTPYAAYLAAEHAGTSGILAVVAAGLYSGWRDPVRMDAETRQTTWAVWSLVLFWLNGIAFVLLACSSRTSSPTVHGPSPTCSSSASRAPSPAPRCWRALRGFIPAPTSPFSSPRSGEGEGGVAGGRLRRRLGRHARHRDPRRRALDPALPPRRPALPPAATS